MSQAKRTICDGIDIEKLEKLSQKELIEIIEYAYNQEGSCVIPDDKYLKYHEIEIEISDCSSTSLFKPEIWADKIMEQLSTPQNMKDAGFTPKDK